MTYIWKEHGIKEVRVCVMEDRITQSEASLLWAMQNCLEIQNEMTSSAGGNTCLDKKQDYTRLKQTKIKVESETIFTVIKAVNLKLVKFMILYN